MWGGHRRSHLVGTWGPATGVLGHVGQGCWRAGLRTGASPGLFGNRHWAPSRRLAVHPQVLSWSWHSSRPTPARRSHTPGGRAGHAAGRTSHLPRRPVSCSRDQMLWILPACSGWLLVFPQAHWCFSMSVSYTRPAAAEAAASAGGGPRATGSSRLPADATPGGAGRAPRPPAGRILSAKPRTSTGDKDAA